jgi:hypothetical protein
MVEPLKFIRAENPALNGKKIATKGPNGAGSMSYN